MTTLLFSLLILAGIIVTVMYLTWLERKFASRMQSRIGPQRVGKPWGLFQPIADGLKLLIKEDIIPQAADRIIYNLAPIVVLLATLLVWVTIPFGYGRAIADLNIGILYILAVSSLAVIGIFMAGWGSNNKYSILSGMRAVNQLISYEVPLVLSALVPVLLAGSMRMSDIMAAQKGLWFIAYPVIGQVAFILFMMAALAESNRIPFDITEAESELVAGYTVEYSGMKFAFFFLAEYAHLLAVSMIASILFLGGTNGPFLPGGLWLTVKVVLMFLFILWIRWSLVRIRLDQILSLSWKVLFPVSLATLILAGAWVAR